MIHHIFFFSVIVAYGLGSFFAGANYGRRAEQRAWAEMLKMGATAEEVYQGLVQYTKKFL